MSNFKSLLNKVNLKKVILAGTFLCTFLLLLALDNKNEQKKDLHRDVVIKYNKPVEGFNVTIYWRPQKFLAGHIIGPAIIEFNHKDSAKSFTVTNNFFGLPTSDDWAETVTNENGYFAGTTQQIINCDYIKPEIIEKLPDCNFFFMDLNFDGENELITKETANGQRWSNTYRVHNPDDQDRRYYPLEPLDYLDGITKIYPFDRRIHIIKSGGANNSEELIYKFDADSQKYILIHR